MLQFHEHNVRFTHKSYSIIEMILISLRAIPITITMFFVICFQQYIRPYIMLPSIRRYLSCIVNLIGLRIVLLFLGVLRFDCDGYRYFSKTGHMLTYRSGWIGVSNHKNILDFIYYSYLFNPTYVLPIFIKEENKIRYTPISFKEAFFASLSHRGFEPLEVQNQSELKKLKCRKMTMQTLVSECFEEMNGPIMIMLPGIFPKQHIKIEKIIGMDMHENQKKCLRSGVVFISSIEPAVKNESQNAKFIKEMAATVYTNQLFLVADCLSKLSSIKLSTTARQIIKYKYQYNKDTYSSFVDEFFVEAGYIFNEISYLDYKKKIDELDQRIASNQ